MKKHERLIIYPLLAVLALATLLDLRLTQAQRGPGEATFRRVTIVDERGRPGIELETVKEEPRVWLYDQHGKVRVSLAVANGDPLLDLYEQDGKPRANLSLQDGKPRLLLMDQDGKTRAMITMIGGEPWLSLDDKEGRRRVTLRTTSEGGGLEVLGPNEDRLAQLWLHRGEPNLALVKQDSKAKAALAFVGGNFVMMIIDKRGDAIWSTP